MPKFGSSTETSTASITITIHKDNNSISKI